MLLQAIPSQVPFTLVVISKVRIFGPRKSSSCSVNRRLAFLHRLGTTFIWTIDKSVNFTATNKGTGGTRDAWLGKYSSADRQVIWVKGFGGTLAENINAICVDGTGDVAGTGNIYVAGDFASTSFDANTGTALTKYGGVDVWVAKIDPANGNTIWAVSFGSAGGGDTATGIVVNKDATALYVTGQYNGNAMVIGSNSLSFLGFGDGFLAKLSTTDGSVIWAIRIASASADFPRGIAIDLSLDEVVVTGTVTINTIAVNGVTYTVSPGAVQGWYDTWIARVNSTGGSMWLRSVGGSGHDQLYAVDIHQATGNIYVAGQTSSATVYFNGTTAAGSTALMIPTVASCDRDGTPRFLRLYKNSTTSDELYTIAVDQATEQVYVGWYKQSTALQTFGDATAAAGVGVFTLDSNGTSISVTMVNGTAAGTTNLVKAAHVDAASNVWIGGLLASTTTSVLQVPYKLYGGTSDAFHVLFDPGLIPIRAPAV